MPPPKTILCYICGRPYLSPSIGIHVEQCKKLFEERENLKPKKERRRLPPDPSQYASSQPIPVKGSISKSAKLSNTLPLETSGNSSFQSQNNYVPTQAMPSGAYGLMECPHCNRRFNDVSYPR